MKKTERNPIKEFIEFTIDFFRSIIKVILSLTKRL